MSTALSPIRSSARATSIIVHRPLAGVLVVADLDRAPEDLAVERVDLPVLAHEILGQLDVALGERLLGLRDLRARASGPSADPLQHLLVDGRLVARPAG